MWLKPTKLLHRLMKFKQTKLPISLSSVVKNDDLNDEILTGDSEYQEFSETYLKLDKSRYCYIIQPYIKWGRNKLRDITPTEQLEEAKSLILTLPTWTVEDTISVPLENFDRNTLFGPGSLKKLRQTIRENPKINLTFINLGWLKKSQIVSLENEFGCSIVDRYNIVMQILKVHAISKHAKLQVALAELYFLRRTTIHEFPLGKFDRERVKLMFQNREQKLKNAIKDLRTQRVLLRNRRQKHDFPIVAVVGYTNSGKTSLIKTLTGEEGLKPRNQLFATLDVTMHSGLLPSGLQILYVDTVGFISHIPTNLIECFVATLEDAVLADVILHVEDISSSCYEFKRRHVLKTLEDLALQTGIDDILNKIISIGNKCDLVPKDKDFGILKISAKDQIGIDALRLKLEDAILKATNRIKLKIKVPSGGDEIRWLYKNSTVVSETPDTKSTQTIIADTIITLANLQKFKHHFIK